MTGDDAFARDFFERYVRGRDVVDYAALLSAAGIRFALAEPGRPSLGPVRMGAGGDGAVVDGPTLVDTPLYEAGIDRGDQITALGGRRVRRPQDVDAALDGRSPGDRIEVRWLSRGAEHRAMVTLAQDESLSASLAPRADDDAVRFRAAWKEGAR